MNDHNLELLSRYVDGEVTARERLRVDDHLTRCAECRQARDEFLAFGARVREATPPLDRFAAKRALNSILASSEASVWRRRVAVPVPALAASLLAFVGIAVLLVPGTGTDEPINPVRAREPWPAVRGAMDLARFDRGERLEAYVEKKRVNDANAENK